jgi:hypothetical protein
MATFKTAALSECGTYRWTLERWWNDGERLCFAMLNPSDADDKEDDRTISRLIEFSRNWGYSGFVVVNLYPYRSPKPTECRKWAMAARQGSDPAAHEALKQNQKLFLSHAATSSLFVAAWGNAFDPAWTIQLVAKIGREIHCLGTNGSGSPTHPLARGKYRIPDDRRPVLWRPKLQDDS